MYCLPGRRRVMSFILYENVDEYLGKMIKDKANILLS
jgi:hypothetical protein